MTTIEFDTVRLVGLKTIDLPIIGLQPTDRYLLKAADGLGPSEVDVFISDESELGGYYQGRRPRSKQLIFRVGLNPTLSTNEKPRDLRAELYGLLTQGFSNRVEVQFLNSGVNVAETFGWVSRFETAIFAKQPEVQITIDTAHPYFTSPNEVDIFANGETVEMATQTWMLNNKGSAPTGFQFEAEYTVAHNQFIIREENSAGRVLVNVFLGSDTFDVGDKIIVNTEFGDRDVKIWDESAGVFKEGIKYLAGSSVWPQFHGGINRLWTWPNANLTHHRWTYKPKYWGV